MEKARYGVLKAEISSQVGEIEQIYLKIEERRRKRGKVASESLAYQLHNLYCAFEDLFRMVADRFENHIEERSRFHVELLKRMAIAIPGVRPALISRKAFELLDSLRAFRHFFRHAYGYELDDRKVRLILEDATRLKGVYPPDVEEFLSSLEQACT